MFSFMQKCAVSDEATLLQCLNIVNLLAVTSLVCAPDMFYRCDHEPCTNVSLVSQMLMERCNFRSTLASCWIFHILSVSLLDKRNECLPIDLELPVTESWQYRNQ